MFVICNLVFGISFLFAQEIKQPNVSGAFYPDNPDDLSAMVDTFLDSVNPEPVNGEIFALISPHAGYGFSGKVAGFGYKLIQDKPYKTVVVIGPSHHYGFSGVSIYPEGEFRTPLGGLTIDKEFTQKLLHKDTEIYFAPEAFEKEHSVEVQLPFLQKVLSDFKIVPIAMGQCSLSTCQKLASLLKEAIGGRKDILLVASSDMYHGYDYEEAEIIDNLTLSYLAQMDAELLYEKLHTGRAQLCGGIPVVTTLLLARELGHNKLQVLKYTNSAIVTGRKIKGTWTVGYSSSVIDTSTSLSINGERSRTIDTSTSLSINGERSRTIDQEKGVAMLNTRQRKRLLEIVRDSIQTYLKTGSKLEVSEVDPVLLKEMGAFVTLHKHGELRGCIGNLVGSQPLYLTVRDMAVEAAVDDPRFPQVNLSELKDIEIEVSALSPLERIDSVDKIIMGTHGVLIRRGFNSGVFLPQVAAETGWSKEEFLSNLCAHKAGLSPDAWKDESTEIYIFSAEIFSEKEP